VVLALQYGSLILFSTIFEEKIVSNIDINDLNYNAVPFFARYLEEQSFEELSAKEMEAVQGGKTDGGLGVPKKILDTPQTQKFPSDQEDGSPGLDSIRC
jgi:bacteriocin-like protein